MDYKQLKNHVRIENIELLKYINKKEIEWLKKHFAFINSLLMGKTDRSETKYKNFINVQGDMPDVTLEMIEKAQWHLQHYPVTTVFTQMQEDKQNDPNSVKMVRAGDQALWFGRGMTGYGDWHLGVYGYKRNPLEMYSGLEVTQEEQVEKLEQLRWLKSGWQIGVLSVQYNGMEINTPEDLEEWHHKNSH